MTVSRILGLLSLCLLLVPALASPVAAEGVVDQVRDRLLEYYNDLDPTDPPEEQVQGAVALVVDLVDMIPELAAACLWFVPGPISLPWIHTNDMGAAAIEFPGVGPADTGSGFSQMTQGQYWLSSSGNSQSTCIP